MLNNCPVKKICETEMTKKGIHFLQCTYPQTYQYVVEMHVQVEMACTSIAGAGCGGIVKQCIYMLTTGL